MKLRLIPAPVFEAEAGGAYQPGDCWYAIPLPGGEHQFWANHGRRLDDGEYAPKHKDRQPMIVVLPTGAIFVVTGRAYKGGYPYGDGWDVQGELPNITVSPSIDFAPGTKYAWHGWIRDGEMTGA